MVQTTIITFFVFFLSFASYVLNMTSFCLFYCTHAVYLLTLIMSYEKMLRCQILCARQDI